jgi:hypothetical protein
MREQLKDIANLLLDQGGSIATTGTGTAYVLSLPSTPSAYDDNMAFLAKIHTAVTGAATININGLGVKPFKKLVNGAAVDFAIGDIPAGHRASCIYSSADSAVLMLNAAVTFGVQFVDSIDDMRALPSPSPGTVIFVGPNAEQFVVVDDPALATDGGTVFIPNSELSAVFSEAIPTTYFLGATGSNCTMEYDLAHTGIDFESVELVVSDPNVLFPTGEVINIWHLHGHVYNPGFVERADPTSAGYSPQLPNIDTGRGKFRDSMGIWTHDYGGAHPPLRTGGALLRYKYAVSGLRFKRVINGSVFQLRWWPVISVDEETPGVQTDNSGKICWCANAAALANAEAVLIDKMYHYNRVVEWPNGVEMRGYGPGVSGFRVVDNGQYKEILRTTSSDGGASDWATVGQTTDPLLKPSTRQWTYDSFFYSQATAFLPATGSVRTRVSGIEWDGNVENNMEIFTQRENKYAWKWANSSSQLFNTVSSSPMTMSNAGNRIIPPGHIWEIHNVKMHGYGHLILGNHNSTAIGTGTLELGNCTVNHWMYLVDGVFETIRCFGYVMGDALRCRLMVAKTIEIRAAPHPEAIFALSSLPVGEQTYVVRAQQYINLNEGAQTDDESHGAVYPSLTKTRLDIGDLFIDLTGLDDWPTAYAYEGSILCWIGADNVHIKAGKIRTGSKQPTQQTFMNTNTGSQSFGPFRNQVYENILIQYGNRAGFSLQSAGVSGDNGVSQLTYRNITVEPMAATHMTNDPSPSGIVIPLGSWRFAEYVPPEPTPPAYSIYDGRIFEFSATTAATLSGDWIDITPPDDGAPTYRVWFSYNGSPATVAGSNLVPVALVTADTPATTAAKFSAAIAGTNPVPGVMAAYVTAATFNTQSVVGSWSSYRGGTKNGFIATNITNATGVTTVLRSYRRNFNPAYISFERYIAPDPISIFLMTIVEVGPNKDITFSFKECVLGAWQFSNITLNTAGAFTAGGVAPVDLAKDQLHFMFTDTVFDMRDTGNNSWSNMDLTLYCGKFRGCRIRTPRVSTGITNMGPGYEQLVSEQGDVVTVPTTAGNTWIDIQTNLFWVPKPGGIRLYPVDAAAAVIWNTNMPSVEWRKSARPVGAAITVGTGAGGTSVALGGGGAYYQGPVAANEDRRAPVLRLNFASALAGGSIQIGWAAAVSS